MTSEVVSHGERDPGRLSAQLDESVIERSVCLEVCAVEVVISSPCSRVGDLEVGLRLIVSGESWDRGSVGQVDEYEADWFLHIGWTSASV